MRKDKEQAFKLRLKGKSYTEIAKELIVPKSTLSAWLSGLTLSKKAQERISKRVRKGILHGLIKRNKLQTHLARQRMHRIRTDAAKEIGHITMHDLKLIGLALYWAEGYKRPLIRNGRTATYHSVSLTNSDSFLIKIFLRFLREICDVPDNKITAGVRIYEHMNTEKTLMYWQTVTKLPKEQFQKTYYGISKSSQGKRPFNRLPYGTIVIRVNQTNLFHKIMGQIEGICKQL